MKAALILTSLFLFAALMGCSDIPGVTEPFNHEIGATRDPGIERNKQVICEFDELSVQAVDEYVVENKAVYNNPPCAMISNYWVTFDAYTDADKMTNGYIPIVEIFKDRECVFESSAFPGENGEVTSFVKVPLENIRFTDLEIHITLLQTDGAVAHNEDRQITLRLSKIRIYKEN